MSQSRELLTPTEGLVDFRKADSVLQLALLDTRLLALSRATVPNELDFSWCLPASKDLLENARLVRKTEEEEAETTIQLGVDDMKGIFDEEVIRRALAPIVEEKDYGERGRKILLTQDLVGECTPVVHGSYTRVESDIVQLYAAGRMTLLSQHTHPFDAMFSPADYASLLLSTATLYPNGKLPDPSMRKRLEYGTQVFCPNNQLFALVTEDTPLMTIEEIKEMERKWKHDLDMEFKREMDRRGLNIDVDRSFRAIVEENPQRFLNFLEAIDPSKGKKNKMKFLDDFLRSCGEIGILVADVLLNERLLGEQLQNGAQIGYARSLSIDLFFSTDLTHFKAFSA